MQVDQNLWLRIASGDQQAYAEVYRYYYKRFFNYGKKFTGDDALIEDSIQEVMLIIWDKRTTLSVIEHAGTYFYASFRHCLLQKLKQQHKQVNNGVQEMLPDFAVDLMIISKETEAEIKNQLQIALNKLTPRQREAIFLRFYEGLSYDQVASIMEITTKATYKIMARALAQLKENIFSFSSFVFWMLQILQSHKSF